MTSCSDHKSVQGRVNKRVRDGLWNYIGYFSWIFWDGDKKKQKKEREGKEKWR